MSNPELSAAPADVQVDVEVGAKRKNQGPRDEERPRKVKPASSAEGTMLSVVRDVPLAKIDRPQASTFIPSAQMMYYVISEMDQLMATARYWTSRAQKWSPLISRLYFGTLFYIQVIRCMVESRTANFHLNRIYRDIEANIDFDAIWIPGPLVIFFKALSVSDSPLSELGIISPTLPPSPGATNGTAHALDQDVRVLLPALVALRRAINRMHIIVNNNAQPWDHNLGSVAANAAAAPPGANANAEIVRDARISPGTIRPIPFAQRERNALANYPTRFDVPNVAANAGNLDWEQFLGFEASYRWFNEIAGIMAIYKKHWVGSVTLSQISVRNGASSLVRVTQYQQYPDHDAHRDSAVESVDLRGTAESFWPEIGQPAIDIGLVTQINWRPSPNFNVAGSHTGEVNHTLLGPFWNFGPNRARTTDYDPQTAIPSLLASELHMDRPLP